MRGRFALGLIVVGALAVLARALGYERVFVDDGTVVFALGDAFYHARRALYSFENFPRLLVFDACLNFPDGSVVPHPPLLDWSLAALARMTGEGRAHFERWLAWSPVAFGALAALATGGLARRLAGPGAGLGAALLYALLPISVDYSRVGNVDHHAAAGWLGASVLWLYVLALDERTPARQLPRAFGALGVACALLLGVWTGSLLYLVPGELALLVAGALGARPSLLLGTGLSALATAALVAPLVAWLPEPNGGWWSATELSCLHLATFAGVGALALAAWGLELLRPEARPARRTLRLAALGALALAAGIALPGVLTGVRRALAFLAKEDAYTGFVLEQLPLFFERGELRLAAGERRLGYLAYLLPLVPLAFLFGGSARAGRAVGLFLCGWSLLFGALAVGQFRYAHDWAPVGCAGTALLLADAAARLRARGVGPRRAGAAAALAGAALWAPALPHYFVPMAEPTWAHLRGAWPGDRALASIEGTQLRFAEAVAAATPETPGCDSSDRVPRYGILAHPALGHVLHWTARRATPADPFGPYIGRENFDAAMRFFTTEAEAEAVVAAERLRTPFVATAEEGGERSARVAQRLQREDGSAAPGRTHLERFRLVAEGPRGGLPMSVAFEPGLRPAPPYKLFTLVRGAVLEVRAAPDSEVTASVPLESPSGRRFVYRARGRAAADGRALLRVPYATRSPAPTRALGPYRVRAGERAWRVQVPERAVREGLTIDLDS